MGVAGDVEKQGECDVPGASGRPGWRDAAPLVVPLLVLQVMSWVGTAGVGVWAASPLVLVVLSPRVPFMVMAASVCPWWVFVPVASARLLAADPFNFELGRRFGAPLASAGSRFRVVRWVWSVTDVVLARFGLLLVLVRPNAATMIVSGASGMGWVPMLAANVVGTVGWVGLVWVAAGSVASPVGVAVSVLARWWWLPVLFSVCAGAGRWWWTRHRRTSGAGPAVDGP